jgi:TolB protein
MIIAMRHLLLAGLLAATAFAQNGALGVFTSSGDVGGPAIKGSSEFKSSSGEYRITGSGANIWGKQDQFQFVWREMTGNFTATATLRFLGQGAEHRKAGIMVRQSLDTDATYADVVRACYRIGDRGLRGRSDSISRWESTRELRRHDSPRVLERHTAATWRAQQAGESVLAVSVV